MLVFLFSRQKKLFPRKVPGTDGLLLITMHVLPPSRFRGPVADTGGAIPFLVRSRNMQEIGKYPLFYDFPERHQGISRQFLRQGFRGQIFLD